MKTSCHLSKNAEKNTFVDHGVPFWLRFTYRVNLPSASDKLGCPRNESAFSVFFLAYFPALAPSLLIYQPPFYKRHKNIRSARWRYRRSTQ